MPPQHPDQPGTPHNLHYLVHEETSDSNHINPTLSIPSPIYLPSLPPYLQTKPSPPPGPASKNGIQTPIPMPCKISPMLPNPSHPSHPSVPPPTSLPIHAKRIPTHPQK